MFQILKIASESFIPALLLFLGLFLKIELSAPVPHQSLKTGCCREVILVVRDALLWPLPLWRGLNKSQCKDCPPGQKKSGRNNVERWPLMDKGSIV